MNADLVNTMAELAAIRKIRHNGSRLDALRKPSHSPVPEAVA
ncbi:hypothetical protein [Pseudomonas lini]